MSILFREWKTSNYADRTIVNVKTSDITIAFAYDFTTGGEVCTRKACEINRKPYVSCQLGVIDGVNYFAIENHLRHCMSLTQDRTVNFAGNGIYTIAKYNTYNQELLNEYFISVVSLIDVICCNNNLKLKIISGGQTGVDQASIIAGDTLGFDCEVLSPKGWKFRDINGVDICDEVKFKERFKI